MRQKHTFFNFTFIGLVIGFFAFFALLVSCSAVAPDRKITVEIPRHPWEESSNEINMWYSLKWSYGNEIRSIYVTPNERRISLEIPIGETAFICAFPLGEMAPFGSVITPFDFSKTFVLNQNDGFIASILLDIDRDVTRGINYSALKRVLEEKFEEKEEGKFYSNALDKVRFLRDIYNGELTASSIVFNQPFAISSFVIPNGVWVREQVLGSSYVITNSLMPSLSLYEGVYRFYNPATDRELVIVVDEKGKDFHYVRQALV